MKLIYVKAFFLLIVQFISSAAAAVELTKIAVAQHHNITNRYLQSIVFAPPPEEVDAVIYGHPKVGYFSTSNFKVNKDGQIELSLVAPTFKHPIKIYTRSKHSLRYIREIKLKSPTPKLFDRISVTITKPGFTKPFYLITAALPYANAEYETLNQEKLRSTRISFVMIVNRLGEIVWIYFPNHAQSYFSNGIIAKPMGASRFGLLDSTTGHFEIIDYRGTSVHQINSLKAFVPYYFYNDFLPFGDHELLASGQELKHLRHPLKFWQKPKSLLVGNIERIDLNKNRKKTAWHSTSNFQALERQNYDKKNPLTLWNDEVADYRFSEVTSMKSVAPEGFLITLAHLNCVALISSNFQSLKWSLGSQKLHTYQLAAKSALSEPQAASLMSGSKIIVLDYPDDKPRLQIFERTESDSAIEPIWTYQFDKVQRSERFGSVKQIASDRIFAYFTEQPETRSSLVPRARDFLVESSIADSEPQASMEVSYPTLSVGRQAHPLDGIGEEMFIGSTPLGD